MELRRLRHVVALTRFGSFAQAAEGVHLSQPAFSRSIQSIEEQLGVELFVRGQRRITPTPYGKLVAARAQKILDEAQSLRRDVESMKAHEYGEIFVGLGPIPAAILLVPVLSQLATEHPRIRTQVEISHWLNLLRMLEEDELDFLITDIRELLSSEKLIVDPMPSFNVGFYCRAGHPLLGEGDVSAEQLPKFALGSFKFPAVGMAELTQALRYEGDPKSLWTVQCDNMLILERVALRSDMIIVGPAPAFHEKVGEGRLVEIQLASPLKIATHFGVVALRGRPLSPAAKLFIDYAIDEFSNGAQGGGHA